MTPQQIDSMKLALEALELINIEFICRNGSHHKKEDWHEWDEDCPITNRWRKAITAIKEALAEHAMREVQRLGQEIEQEPLADRAFLERTLIAMEGVIDVADRKTDEFDALRACIIELTLMLYTAPPQRTWVGLNDDEIDYLIHLAYTGDEEFVQTIEAKLKEKNT